MSMVLPSCGGGSSRVDAGAEKISDTSAGGTTIIDTPIYLPTALPPDPAKETVQVATTENGYSLTAQFGAATYTLKVDGHNKGPTELTDEQLAGAHHQPSASGGLSWSDTIASVDIRASGSERPGGSAETIIAEGLTVVPRSVLDVFLADPGTQHNLPLEGVRFGGSEVSVDNALIGKLGHVKVAFKDARETVYQPFCQACSYPRWLTGWQAGDRSYSLATIPSSASIQVPEGAEAEKVFYPLFATDLYLFRADSDKLGVPVTYIQDGVEARTTLAIHATPE